MTDESTYDIDLNAEIDRLFDDSSLPSVDQPRAVILMGGVAAGKTQLRIKDYSRGFVLIDAAEMFHHLSRGDGMLDFPDAFAEPLELIGPMVAERAISERRHLVTEIIGDDVPTTMELIAALQAAGYKVEVVSVTCDRVEAYKRNLNRGDNISAFYAGPFQTRWIVAGCRSAAVGAQPA